MRLWIRVDAGYTFKGKAPEELANQITLHTECLFGSLSYYFATISYKKHEKTEYQQYIMDFEKTHT